MKDKNIYVLFFFYFKPMGLYSDGLVHGLMFTLVTGVGLYEDGWAYTRMGLYSGGLIRGSLQF